MSTGQPLLMIDVDGVLNPFPLDRHSSLPGLGFELHHLTPQDYDVSNPLHGNANTYQVYLNPEHGRMLLELAEKTGIELAWGTTWEHEANRLIAPLLGLPELAQVARFPRPGFRWTGQTWKLEGMRTFAAQPEMADRPVIWLDDDLHDDAIDWARERTAGGAPTAIVQVNGGSGFRQRHVEWIESWLERLAQ